MARFSCKSSTIFLTLVVYLFLFNQIKAMDVNMLNEDGETLLHVAAHAGQTKAVELLLSQGANVNAKDNDQFTPALLAAQQNNTHVVLLLITHRAELWHSDNKGNTVLTWIGLYRNHTLAEALTAHSSKLKKNDDDGGPLFWAVDEGDINAIEILLSNGGKINAYDGYGKTLLHAAAMRGRKKVFELLLARGGDPNALTKGLFDSGQTALHRAAGQGAIEIVKLLLDRSFPINTASSYGSTALHLAALSGHTAVVELLLVKGANPLTINAGHKIPLDLAEKKEVITLLIRWMEQPMYVSYTISVDLYK